MSKPLSLHVVAAEEQLIVGTTVDVFGESHLTRFATVFEDDGDTGYFYALDPEKPDNVICDAMQIYNVKNVTDAHKPSKVEIVWSDDGLKSGLLINSYFHAVFDFAARRGYCRTGFPSSDKRWTEHENDWSDEAYELFK